MQFLLRKGLLFVLKSPHHRIFYLDEATLYTLLRLNDGRGKSPTGGIVPIGF